MSYLPEGHYWITNARPTADDADSAGLVVVKRSQLSDTPVAVHWSYVGSNIPWRHSPYYKPMDSQWITDRLPKSADADAFGEVLTRSPLNGLNNRPWWDVCKGSPWKHTDAYEVEAGTKVTTFNPEQVKPVAAPAEPALICTFTHNGKVYEAKAYPKEPSLKQKALDRCNDYIDPDGIIRKALETIPE